MCGDVRLLRPYRTVVAGNLAGLSTSTFAGNLEKSIAKAAKQAETRSQKRGGSTILTAAVAGWFVGGMAVGPSAFISNENSRFAEFGEANAVNKNLVTVSKRISW